MTEGKKGDRLIMAPSEYPIANAQYPMMNGVQWAVGVGGRRWLRRRRGRKGRDR